MSRDTSNRSLASSICPGGLTHGWTGKENVRLPTVALPLRTLLQHGQRIPMRLRDYPMTFLIRQDYGGYLLLLIHRQYLFLQPKRR